MLQTLTRKWWLILLQGVVLIILSFYIFHNPVGVLAGISFWFGLTVLGAGVLGIVAWFGADKTEREGLALAWGILTVVLGMLMLFNLLATMKTVTMIFGFWCLLSGVFLLKAGWTLKNISAMMGWVVVVSGIFCAVVGVIMILNIGAGAIGISSLFGVQTFLTGTGLILLSFAKKSVTENVKERIASVKR